MLSIERMALAMRLRAPDRVPVMCQLAIGHYFLHAGLGPREIWFTSEGFAEALVRLARRYRFDGLLINLTGRDPHYERYVDRMTHEDGGTRVHWKNGDRTLVPVDDNPHYFLRDGRRQPPDFPALDPEDLFYIEPWDLTGITVPYRWGFEREPRPFDEFFPDYVFDTLRLVRAKAGGELSIHAEINSPWSQLMDLLGYERALMALLVDPGKIKACLERLVLGAAELGRRYAAEGADAILITSAFAGAGFISRGCYEEFILPYERRLIDKIKADFDLPIYTHTCGAIGDRLDLMLRTGTNGIDTLDPPPLGTVNLEEAKAALQGKAFIKGNMDAVSTLMRGTPDEVRRDAHWRVEVGKPGGGYILSTACSVAPCTPPENIAVLAEVAERYGAYESRPS